MFFNLSFRLANYEESCKWYRSPNAIQRPVALTMQRLFCANDERIRGCYWMAPLAPYEKPKFLVSGGSMVAKLKLKGIDGRAPPGVEPAA